MPDHPSPESPTHQPVYFDDADPERFEALFGTEERCLAHVVRRLHPQGFRCPRCRRIWFELLPNNKVLRCRGCLQRTRVLAGTIFHRTKLPLTTWFKAAFLLRHSDTNAHRLAPLLGVTYRTSWLLCHKLRFAMGVVQARTPAPGTPQPRRLSGERGAESPGPHGCERLERPDLARRSDTFYPWARWLRERGPLPEESPLADEARGQLGYQFSGSIGERYLQLYLDELAFRFDRRHQSLERFFADLAAALPLTPARTRRELGRLPVPKPVRPWLALREQAQRSSSSSAGSGGTTGAGPQPSRSATA
jgi:hypothetical protein